LVQTRHPSIERNLKHCSRSRLRQGGKLVPISCEQLDHNRRTYFGIQTAPCLRAPHLWHRAVISSAVPADARKRLGIDHEVLLPNRSEVTQETAAIGETGLGAEKASRPARWKLGQPGEEQAAEERAQHPHRLQEGRTRRYPAPAVEREMRPRGKIMWTWGW
jgi:hypothetical protein